MKRITDCLQAPITVEGKLVLLAMVAGRLSKLTVREAADLCNFSIGEAADAFLSLKTARINVSASNHECELNAEWNPQIQNGASKNVA